MGRGFDPFRPTPLLQLEEKAESIALGTHAIYIGTSQGSIQHYELPPETANDDSSASACVSPPRRKATAKVSKKPVEQLCLVGDFLVALSDGGVFVLGAEDVCASAPSSVTRDVKCICPHTLPTSSGGSEDYTGPMEVCVAARKKLILYAASGRHLALEARQEFPTPDVALTVAWHGSWIVAGFKAKYCLYSATSGIPRDICPLDGKTTPRLALLPPSASTQPASQGELLLVVSETISQFYRLDTQQMSARNSITWPRRVGPIAAVGPYILGSPGGGQVDVFTLREQRCSQTLALPGTILELAFHKSRIIVASDTALTVLERLPFERLAKQLLLQGRFGDALDLLNTTYSSEDPERSKWLHQLHALSGWQLFRELAFEKAFRHFLFSKTVRLDKILSFWRSFLPHDWTWDSKGAGDDGSPETCDLEDLVRSQLQSKAGGASVDASAVAACVETANSCMAAFLLRYREAVLIGGQADGKEVDKILSPIDTLLIKLLILLDEEDDSRLQKLMRSQVRCTTDEALETFLREKKRRDVLAKLCRTQKKYEQALQEWNGVLDEASEDLAQGVRTSRMTRQQIVAEMVSVLSLAAGSPELLRRFIPRLIHVDSAPVLPLLAPRGAAASLPVAEVLELLKSTPDLSLQYLEHLVLKRPQEADPEHSLQLAKGYLSKLQAVCERSPDELDRQPSVLATRRKLQRLVAEAPDLDSGSLLPEVEKAGTMLLPEKVSLCRRANKHREAFLALVQDLNDLSRAEVYCRLLMAEGDGEREAINTKNDAVSLFAEKLPLWATPVVFPFPKKKTQPSAAFPSAGGAQEDSSLPAADLGSSPAASDLVDDTARPLILFLATLLCTWTAADQRVRVLPKVAAEYKDAAISLLMGYAGHSDLPPHEVLAILPDSWTLESLGGYLSKCARLHLHERRASLLEENLSSMVYLKTYSAWAQERSAKVTMDKEKCCPTCNRRFVGQDNVAKAFVAYPNETCVHLQCKEDLSICPKTGRNFTDNLSIYCSTLAASSPEPPSS